MATFVGWIVDTVKFAEKILDAGIFAVQCVEVIERLLGYPKRSCKVGPVLF